MDEYVYYCKHGNELEDIALVRNEPLTDEQLDVLKQAMAKDGYHLTRMVAYKGYEMPNFAQTVNI